MATVVLESSKNLDCGHDHMKGVKDLMDAGVMDSVPAKYVFPQDRRPSAAEILQGESVPIIDISSLDGSQQERLQTIQSIGEACAEWGIFRVINHGIEASLIASMLDVAHQFFLLSTEEKMKYGSREVLDPVKYGTSFDPKDQVFSWRDYLRHFCHPVLQTPDNPPNYRDTAGQYFKETRKLGLKLMVAISESLGLQPTYIETVFGEGLHAGVLNFYPRCPEPELTLGFAPHSDPGGLAILLQDEVGGLQVHHKGHWVAVQPVPNTFVVHVCDQLEIVSNGRYKSAEHRALVNAERTRISIAAAEGPALDALIFPAPQLVDEIHPPMYKSMLYREFHKVRHSIQLKGKNALEQLKITKQE
ncbi:hypothetical protein SUGI_1085130 [Cryptomeria japonica]|uniref:flavanone 3-dioxygenase 2 n=1 Tax=Cryptomeria japonica TaxID=3369 RepID=UPI002414C5E4|nr:flavanone 3-dioxygenase 2 [Cryptomeria japonica]GLJ50951.1 hypothetical protein SUGI_1085130 [Cryptomeria japonica]